MSAYVNQFGDRGGRGKPRTMSHTFAIAFLRVQIIRKFLVRLKCTWCSWNTSGNFSTAHQQSMVEINRGLTYAASVALQTRGKPLKEKGTWRIT